MNGDLSIDTIMRFTAAFCDVRVSAIISPRRDAQTVKARWIAMYLARETSNRSLPEIARLFGNRDHTSVLHACREMKARVARDPELAALVAKIASYLDRPAEAA